MAWDPVSERTIQFGGEVYARFATTWSYGPRDPASYTPFGVITSDAGTARIGAR